MDRPCVVCGREAEDLHHPTGRARGSGQYLDPELRVPVCHDDHEVLSDDEKRRADLEPDGAATPMTRGEHVEMSLRRLAAFGGRVAEGVPIEWLRAIIATVARHVEHWANELATERMALDVGLPGWRSLPGING